MSSPTADSQWPLWEVFVQEKAGAPHEHAGSVHAPDGELALQAARDVYARRGPIASLWVVESERIVATTTADAASFLEPGPEKLYRHSRFYSGPKARKTK